jgi:HrpA-like RNA helicase
MAISQTQPLPFICRWFGGDAALPALRAAASALVEDWCSVANCRQRAGRAGRTEPGVVVRLFSSATFAHFPAQPSPELMRVPLEVRDTFELKRPLLSPPPSPSLVLLLFPTTLQMTVQTFCLFVRSNESQWAT